MTITYHGRELREFARDLTAKKYEPMRARLLAIAEQYDKLGETYLGETDRLRQEIDEKDEEIQELEGEIEALTGASRNALGQGGHDYLKSQAERQRWGLDFETDLDKLLTEAYAR